MRKHKSFAVILTIAMMAAMIPFSSFADETIKISNAEQLKAFAEEVNDGNNYAGKTVVLTNNITLDGDWIPVGNGSRSGSGAVGNSFKGTFDGNGKTVTGIKISSQTGVDNAIGFFGVLDGATVRNLILQNVDIVVSNNECAGGAAGLMVNDSIIENVTVYGNVSVKRGNGGIVGRMTKSGTIKDCTNYATVSGTGANVGGIVGAAYYTDNYTSDTDAMVITGCVNNGAVNGTAGVVGGIAGLSSANVVNCINNENITGNGADVAGIVAEQQNYGSVIGCVNNGNITNHSSNAYGTGGIIGWTRYNGTADNYPAKEIIEVRNNINNGNISGGNDGGGIIGTVYNAVRIIGNENNAEQISGTTFAAGIVGNIQNTENPIDGSNGETIPRDYYVIYNNVSKTSIDKISAGCKSEYVYLNPGSEYAENITDNSDEWIAQVGEDKYTGLQIAIEAAQDGPVKTVTLLKDIDADVWSQIWNIEGITIDGNGKTIKVKEIDSLQNHDAILHSAGGNVFENIIFDLTEISASKAQGNRAISAAAGDVIRNVTILGNDDLSYGITCSGTEAADETVMIEDCTFKNCHYGVYDDEGKTVENLVIKNSGFEGCEYAIILRSDNGEFTGNTVTDGKLNILSDDQTVTGNKFEGESRIKFYASGAEFKNNQISTESYLDFDKDVEGKVDVSENYWGGGEPAADQLGNADNVTGADVYYLKSTMNPEDLNTYVAEDGQEPEDQNKPEVKPDSSAQTGDDSNMAIPFAAAGLALAAMAAVVATRKKHN